MFRLLRYFSIASLLALLLALAATVWISREHALSQLVASRQATNVAVTQAFVNSLWPHFSGYLQGVGALDTAALRNDPETARLDAEVRLLARGLGILKVKIMTLDARMVFSTQNSEIGTDYSRSQGFAVAAAGGIFSESRHRDEFASMDGRVTNVHVISSYAPVVRSDGRIDAVMEVYADVTADLAGIDRTTLRLGVRIAAVFSVLYVLLFLVVRHGDRLLRRQYRDLAEANDRLTAKGAALEREMAARREIESEMLAMREAQVTDRAKNAMLANMSHELRTPLNAIIGFSQLIEARIFGPAAIDRYAGYAADIHKAGQHLLDIINSLLDLAKAEAGEATIHEETVDLNDCARDSLRLVEHRAAKGAVALHCELAPDAAALIADPRLVRQILINLLSNAVKFTRPGGSVTLSAALLADGSLRLAVADTGIGIAAKDIPRVMSPFGQVEDGLTRRYEGTGLGLPIVKSLVELHGGAFKLESTPGVGTVAICLFAPNRVLAGPAGLIENRPAGVAAPQPVAA